jgi:hypothetical protein
MLHKTLIVATATIPARIIHRFSTLACAIALTLLVASNVAAYQLRTDQPSGGASVDPRLDLSIGNQHLRFKLATNAGYDVLVRG